MTIMTPVKPKISKFQAEKSGHVGVNMLYSGFTHERLLSSYMLTFRMNVISFHSKSPMDYFYKIKSMAYGSKM
jgi:hypothetical protein